MPRFCVGCHIAMAEMGELSRRKTRAEKAPYVCAVGKPYVSYLLRKPRTSRDTIYTSSVASYMSRSLFKPSSKPSSCTCKPQVKMYRLNGKFASSASVIRGLSFPLYKWPCYQHLCALVRSVFTLSLNHADSDPG